MAIWSPALSFLPRLVSASPFTRTAPPAISTFAPPPLDGEAGGLEQRIEGDVIAAQQEADRVGQGAV